MGAAKKTLVIVESPSKAKTIGKYLGSRYKVVASAGHVRDLPLSSLGISIENNFEPKYINMRKKSDIIRMLKAEAKEAGKIYLATDPDREGEAISWHIAQLLELDGNSECRIEFNEITENAIKEAISHPRKISAALVDAQQARRVLDRLVGYQISPIIWRKVKYGLSAGRVQSATLKMICDREREIQAFVPQEFWNISAQLKTETKPPKGFTAKLAEYKGKKFVPESEKQADKVLSDLEKGTFTVADISEKRKSQKARAPFTTSTLQQEASTKLGFTSKKTMLLAQQLYEGGHVTYIRTDSVRISDVAKQAAESFIAEKYGKEYVGNNFYSNKKGAVQDAHEAIRPSHIDVTPELASEKLDRDQLRLYRLIWSRFMASRMKSAEFDVMTCEIVNGDYTFKAHGSKPVFDGYLRVYRASDDDDESKLLPPLKNGEELECEGISKEQSFTQGPMRYTEASLVKDMEDKNIGRPSTYAPTIATLLERTYINKVDKKSLAPTELGFAATKFMEEYFKDIVDVKFTAAMEDSLDTVESEHADWKKLIADFYYGGFEDALNAAGFAEHVKIEKPAPEPTGETCPECGKPLVWRESKYGRFVACSGFPACRYKPPKAPAELKKIGVKCPNCGGDIVERKGKRGTVFYGCSNYPQCKTIFNKKPTDKLCPKCGSIMTEHRLKHTNYLCSNRQCGYKE